MTLLRFSIVISVLISSLVQSHDLYLGYPDVASRLIFNKVYQENPAIWLRYEEVRVNASRNEVISLIKVIDLREDKRGDVYIKAGGVGENFVVLELESPTIFRGYNFWIEVYAIQTGYFTYNRG
ncbi:hypothetical protein EVAR_25944_1 [Eumeta japonica]|uniref:Salivary secreted peptide n=1 Tax=Eumeta variegata TaxID=151549 RepID=A0A4C1V2Y5_EUMVA|nr:hypothetical protein EVAR_25944_1 [Eumeta japonica]